MTQGILAIFFGAALFTLVLIPIIGISYRKHGGLSPLRMIGWLAFFVYAMAIWAYTLVPIPEADNIVCVGYELDPMQGFRDIFNSPLNSISAILNNTPLMQVALNIALFVPLGFLLRTMFRKGVVVATFVGFLVSLLIETTQITGVWWLYPCAYRIFDTNDLVTNTFGALLGSVIAGIFVGSRKHIVKVAEQEAAELAKAPPVLTFWRRALGMFSDVLAAGLVVVFLQVAKNAIYLYVLNVKVTEIPTWTDTVILLFVFVAGLVWTLLNSATVGEWLVLLKTEPRWKFPIFWIFVRYIFGIGGLILLTLVDNIWIVLFVAVSIIVVIVDKSRRGLAARIGNADVVIR
ncbi:MAG: VanZ family protein [Microbacteriaceae bacterium]|nr:VanZ family protein [Microbacteriaceae bacterium]